MGLSTFSNDSPYGELVDLRYANPKLAVRTIEKNRDVILGIKIRLSRSIAGEHDLEALKLAREAADAVGLPLMVHIGGSYSPLERILSILNKGDVVTHCFHGAEGGILDERGRVLSSVLKAVERGVHLDVGHGAGSFSFDTAERAMRQGVLPGTISSDLHVYNINGPVYDLATTLSKFLYLGITLEEVIQRVTVNPAKIFRFPHGLGTLREGAEADVAVFRLEEGEVEFMDSENQKRLGHRRLVPALTVRSGRLFGSGLASLESGGEEHALGQHH